MSDRHLPDTGIATVLFSRDPTILKRLPDADEAFIPCIVMGELH